MSNLWRPVKKLLTIYQAQKILEPYVDDMVLSIRRGLTTYQQIPAAIRAQYRPRTAANNLNDFIVFDAVQRFAGHEPEIQIDEDCEGALFIFKSQASVRFKKVNGKLRSSNIATDRQRKIQYQYELDGVSRCTQVTVGYTMNDTFTQVGAIHIVCWHGERVHSALPIGESVDPFLFSLGRKSTRDSGQGPEVHSKTGRKKKKGG